MRSSSSTNEAALGGSTGSVDDEVPPAELVGVSLSGAFKGIPAGVDSGAWYGRRGDELLWVTVVGRPEVEITEYTIHRGYSPVLAVRGRALVPLEWVDGRTTIGDYEVGDCVRRHADDRAR